MCLAIPGEIIKIDGMIAIVRYPHENRKVMIDPNIPIEIGDFVLVQMATVIDKIDKAKAMESWSEWERIQTDVENSNSSSNSL